LAQALELTNLDRDAFFNTEFVIMHGHTVPDWSGVALSFCRRPVFSVLYRLSENIQAIRLLISNRYYYQAVALLRSMYEMSLDFYVDWLAPEQIGFWLQIHARVNREGFKQAMQLACRSKDPKRAKVLSEHKSYCYNFFSNVSNKAVMSPLGRSFYDEVYSFSSEVVHQDFNMTEVYALFMENPEYRSFDTKAIVTLVRCMDMITGKVYSRIEKDIGGI
jgi:hypothetical protein